MSYEPVKPGKWISPSKKAYRMECCDCGLVHLLQFRHIKWGRGRKIQIRAWRDEVATNERRNIRENPELLDKEGKDNG
jgi:hypothetical protein